MAFPQVTGTPTSGPTSAGGSATTSHVLTLPSGIVSGELLLAVFSCDWQSPRTFSWPAGWTELAQYTDANDVALLVGWRIADGSEGASITVTSSGAEKGAYWVTRITGWHGITPPEISVAGTGLSTAPNPGFLQPSWGSLDTLWVAASAADHGTSTHTAAPASYGNLVNVEDGDAGASTLGVARRELNAISDDPAAFTTDRSDQWVAATIAIRPSVGAAVSLAASIGSVASVAASLAVAVTLSASVAAVSTVSAALQAGEAGQLAASIETTSSVSASLSQARPLAASIISTSSASAAIAQARPLHAGFSIVGSPNYRGSDLYRSSLGYREGTGSATVTGGIQTVSSVSASLQVGIVLSADPIVGVSSVSAHLAGPVNWQIIIDGTEVTDYVRPFNALRIVTRGHEGSGTATIPIRDPTGALSIGTDQVLKVIQRSSILFEGPIRTIKRGDPGWSTGPRLQTLECQDYTTYLDDDVIETAYRSATESDKSRVTWLINTHSTRGITAGAEVQQLLASMPGGEDGRPEQDFSGKTLREALDQICRITGGRYYVDLSKRLHYFATEALTAPYVLSDNPDGSTSVGYSNFTLDDDSIDKAHEVLVVGTEAKPDEGIAAVKVWRSIASPPALGERRRAVIRDPNIMTVAQATQVGDAYLDQYGSDRNTGRVSTTAPGFRPGQAVTIEHDAHGTNQYRIAAVTAHTISPEEVRFDLELNDAEIDLGDVISGTRRTIDVIQTTVSQSAASVAQLQAAGANLIPDSSFEAATPAAWGVGSGWTHGLLQLDSHRGRHVARLQLTNAASGTFSTADYLFINRADEYWISFWSRMRLLSSSSGQLWLYEYDSASAIVAQTKLAEIAAPETEWTRHISHFGATEQVGRRAFHASTVKVKLVFFAPLSTLLQWDIDGVQFERGGRPTAYAPMPEELYNVPGEVVIDEAGITIINGALVVKNPGGTVVIDGTSNMHKIVATGTGNWPAQGSSGTVTVDITLSTGLTYRPANAVYGHFGGSLGAIHLPFFVPDNFIPTDTVGFVDLFEAGAQLIGANQTRVHARKSTKRSTGLQGYSFRYYVYKEEAI